MAKQTRRLGRGLASLMGEVAEPENALRAATAAVSSGRDIAIESIRPNPQQPRTEFDDEALRELANSIRQSGVIQPVVVRPTDGTYELIAGERRWRAAQLAGLTALPAVVRDATDQQMLEFALIENIQRADLNPLDRARAYRQACEQFGESAETLAEALGEDRTTVTNYMRLLELPDEVQALVRGGALSMGHARALLGLASKEVMGKLAEEAVETGHSVRKLEELVRRAKSNGKATAKEADDGEAPKKRPLVADLEERFSQSLGTRVTIQEGRKRNTGRIVINYFSVDDFSRVAAKLGVDLDEL